MTALPTCFTEDTLICTEQGYKKIIDVVLEDKVLTKEGDFKSVYDVMITPYVGSLVGIKRKGDTDMIKCTPNHKFFVRGKGWVESLFIEEGDYVGVPINTQNIIPDISYSKSSNQFSSTTKEYKTDMNNYDLWWVMGYFLGDGWIRKDRNDIQFAVSHKESDIVLPKLKSVFGNILKGQASGKSDRYTATSVEYHNLFSLFGSGAENKSIPAFIINAPTNLVKEFIDGYRMADGTKTKEELEFGTISKSIAYGCQILLAKLGIACAVTIGNKKPYHVIEGRTVKQFEKYYIVKQYSGIIKDVEVDLDENTIWYRVTDKFLFKDMDVNVYNISVVDSHTYTCNNIITKNCHSEFQVIGVPLEDGKFGFELHLQQRSTDVFLGAPFNIASYGLLAKILEMFTGYEALAIDLTFKCVHFYDNQYDAARELLSRDPKTHPNCELQIDFPKLDNPDHFSLDDKLDLMKIDQFKLIGYTSDAEIKVEMLAPKE
jgi:intein/homing endonuclease